LKQAKGAAQTGGTLLLYGAANAHFNALLELCERLTDGMRSRLSKIVEIGEVRFEQLVEINWATTTRCPWIGNYRELPRILVQVEKNAASVFKVVGQARSEANALTLKERKDQAEEETKSFLTAAEGLTRTAGKSMQISYNSFQSLESSNKANESVDKVTKALKDRDSSEKQKEKEEEQKIQQQFLEEKAKAQPESPSVKQYMIAITTSNDIGSGVDCAIGLVLIGSKGKTATIELPDEDKSRFEAGQTDRFDIDVEGDIGEPSELIFGLDTESSKELVIDWTIGGVELLDKASGRRYVFPDAKKAVLGNGLRKKVKNFKAERKTQ